MLDSETIIGITEVISFFFLAHTAAMLVDRKQFYPRCSEACFYNLEDKLKKIEADDNLEKNIKKGFDEEKENYYLRTTTERMVTKRIVFVNTFSLIVFLSSFMHNWFERKAALLAVVVIVSVSAFSFINVHFKKVFKKRDEDMIHKMSCYAEDCKKQKQQRRRKMDRAFL